MKISSELSNQIKFNRQNHKKNVCTLQYYNFSYFTCILCRINMLLIVIVICIVINSEIYRHRSRVIIRGGGGILCCEHNIINIKFNNSIIL
jgi:hypothetical protein